MYSLYPAGVNGGGGRQPAGRSGGLDRGRDHSLAPKIWQRLKIEATTLASPNPEPALGPATLRLGAGLKLPPPSAAAARRGAARLGSLGWMGRRTTGTRGLGRKRGVTFIRRPPYGRASLSFTYRFARKAIFKRDFTVYATTIVKEMCGYSVVSTNKDDRSCDNSRNNPWNRII